MGQVSGADVAGLQQLGNHMRRAASQLDGIRNDVTAVFNRTHWEGEDGEYYREQWRYQYSGLLYNAIVTAQAAGDDLLRNAEQQLWASGEAGGSLITGSVPWTGVGGFGPVIGLVIADGKIAYDSIDDLLLIPGAINLLGKYPQIAPDIAKFARGVKVAKALSTLESVSKRFDELNLGIDSFELSYSLIATGFSWETGKHALDAAFDIAALASISCPPAALAIGIVHFGFDIATDPEERQEIIDGVRDVGSFVAHTATDVAHVATEAAGVAVNVVSGVVNADVHAAEDVAKAATSVVSGGVNAVRNLFHW